MSVLIWNQTICGSGSVPDRIFEKVNFRISQHTITKALKEFSMQRARISFDT